MLSLQSDVASPSWSAPGPPLQASPPLQPDPDLPEGVGEFPEAVLYPLGSFLAIVLVGRYVVVPALVRIVRARNRQSPTLVQAVDRYARLLVLVVATLVAVGVAGYGYLLSGSAIVVAAATLAIGVAGQEVIGNLVSGLFLVSDPDFNVGDWISWEDDEGVVETIRFRVTRVRTPNNEVVTVPNTTLATTAVRRPYSRNRYRLVVRVAIATDEDVRAATTAIEEELSDVEEVLDDPPPQIAVEELGADGIWLAAAFWIHQPTRGAVVDVRSACVRRVQERFLADDVDFSPPSGQDLSGTVRVEQTDGAG